MKALSSPPDPPVSPSALPSPPTSPTSPRPATTTRTRVKAPRRPDSLGSIPSIANPPKRHGERTKSMSSPLCGTVSANPGGPGFDDRTVAPASTRRAVASKRRKPSITYYTPSSPSPWGQRLRSHRTSSSSPRDGEPAVANGEENVSQRSSLMLGSHSSSTRESVCSLDGVGAREREPLTLFEKHADLLHVIAQEERKCLELRDLLAAHEKQLAELKRKWERIVNRGQDPLLNPPLTAGLGGVALDGLKEGVRIIAAGLSDLGGAIQELEPSDKNTSEPKSFNHSLHEYNNTLNTCAKRTGSEQPPTNPMPSVQEVVHVSDQVLEAEQKSTTATAPSLSRTGSLNYRMHKRASCAPAEELTTSSSAFVPSAAQKPKPADLDVGMPLILASSPVLVSPFSSVRPASARSALKSPVLGSAWTAVPMSAGPVSSWVDSMGKKLNELQKGQTFSKSQKRASLLFAGVSNTITSALSPGPTPTTPAPFPASTSTTVPPSTFPVSIQSSLIMVPPSPRPQAQLQPRSHPSYETMMDWLEDDEEQQMGGALLVPDSKQQPLSVRTTGMVIEQGWTDATAAAAAVSSFDDEWNW